MIQRGDTVEMEGNDSVRALQAMIGEWAESKGWRDRSLGRRWLRKQSGSEPTEVQRSLAYIALRHADWSRALEAIRKGFEPEEHFRSLDHSEIIGGAEAWPVPPMGVLAKLALIHSEVSEAVEEVIEGRIRTERIDGKPEGLDIELADVVIRCLQLADEMGLDISAAIQEKMAYNEGRPFKHGKLA